MRKQSAAARLRAAQERALVAEREAKTLRATLYRIAADFSDREIVSDFSMGAPADSAIRTARILGYVVTVNPGRVDSEKFTLRAHRPE